MMIAVLFEGVPAGWRILFVAALVVIAVMFAWSCLLFARALRSGRRMRREPEGDTDAFVWVFVVPALDEEVTIRDSVERLLAVPVQHRMVVVVDDASEDGTPEILASIDHPDLVVLRREPPDARAGKSAALNHAYAALADRLDTADRARTVVTVVDADGRLDPDTPARMAAHLEDPAVGGVQLLVRIYNRKRVLAWLQDIEFGVYGSLFQAGRNAVGTAGLGGNGQATRLAALDDVAGPHGPWRDCLTEDQDLGLRLLAAGWRIRQDLAGAVHQQGLSTVRPLFRQRTRWSQGNLQAMSLTGRVARAPFALPARAEVLFHLFMPWWQTIVGAALVAAVVLAVTGVAPLWSDGPTLQLVVIYLLAFGGTVLGCVAAYWRRGPHGWLLGFLVGHVYALYTWFIWPVLLRSIGRQLVGRRSWSKTAREPITAAAEATG